MSIIHMIYKAKSSEAKVILMSNVASKLSPTKVFRCVTWLAVKDQ